MGANNIKLTTEKFIEKAIAKHGNKYDYSQTIYINSKSKVKIICPKHGMFEQNASAHHVRGDGCMGCRLDKTGDRIRATISEYIEKAIKVHGNEYDYSLVHKFKRSDEYGKIICKKHGVFEVRLCSHLLGYKCNKCSYETRKRARLIEFKQFLERATEKFGNTYIYLEESYSKMSSPVTYFCKTHGQVSQVADWHLKSQGCTKCFAKNEKSNTKAFVEKALVIHKGFYNYDLVDYKKNDEKVKIRCPYHGIFEQIPNTHLLGGGCMECGRAETNGFSRRQFESAAKGRACSIYLIKIWNDSESFYKIGIATKAVENRFKKFNQTGYKVKRIQVASGKATDIWNLEKKVLKEFNLYKYKPLISFGGSTECFSLSLPINEIIDNLKTLEIEPTS